MLLIKFPSDHFNIYDFMEFCSQPTRGSSNFKLQHKLCNKDFDRNFYFNSIPRLWNLLPTLDINLPLSTIKSNLQLFFWDNFMSSFESSNAPSTTYVHALSVLSILWICILVIFWCKVVCLCLCLAAGSISVVLQHTTQSLFCHSLCIAISFPSDHLCCKDNN